jgi:hypothetical protein
VGIIAYQCPTCGVIGVYSGATLLKKWNLKSSKTKLGAWTSKLLTTRKAVVTVKVLSSAKQVVIDAVGVQR